MVHQIHITQFEWQKAQHNKLRRGLKELCVKKHSEWVHPIFMSLTGMINDPR